MKTEVTIELALSDSNGCDGCIFNSGRQCYIIGENLGLPDCEDGYVYKIKNIADMKSEVKKQMDELKAFVIKTQYMLPTEESILLNVIYHKLLSALIISNQSEIINK